MRGKFITVEGGEGVGKSTNIAFIAETLRQAGVEVEITREPGGTPLAEEIREVLIKCRNEAVHPDTELLLMFAARAQHLNEKIKPALDAGTWVVCDRFTDATYAYQSGGRKLPSEKVANLETFVQGALRPDMTILLDAPVEVGMARAQKRAALDRFEEEKVDFFNRVRNNYLERAKDEPDRFAIVGADRSLSEVQEELKALMLSTLASDD
jgi:dTMP kinase